MYKLSSFSLDKPLCLLDSRLEAYVLSEGGQTPKGRTPQVWLS